MSAVATLSPSMLAIHELSARIALSNAKQVDKDFLFADILPPPTEDLFQVMQQMSEAGYVIGDPVKFTPSRKRSHTEWHLPVCKDSWSAMLAFFVEEQAC